MQMLNAKQEKFVQNLIKGMSQREAYKDAYNAKYKDEAIDSKASALFNLDKVQVRYRELLDKVADKAIMSAKQRMKWLSDVVNEKVQEKIVTHHLDIEGNEHTITREYPAELSTKIKAIDTLNKMTGEYKTILSGNVGLTYEEALKKVSGEDDY